jgi:hypothetical protein
MGIDAQLAVGPIQRIAHHVEGLYGAFWLIHRRA